MLLLTQVDNPLLVARQLRLDPNDSKTPCEHVSNEGEERGEDEGKIPGAEEGLEAEKLAGNVSGGESINLIIVNE